MCSSYLYYFFFSSIEPLVLKKNVAKLNKGKLLFNDEPHVFDKEKEKQKTQKNKDKKSRKKQARMARMRANADDDGDNDVSMESLDDVIPAKDSKPASNGSAQKKLRGSKQ